MVFAKKNWDIPVLCYRRVVSGSFYVLCFPWPLPHIAAGGLSRHWAMHVGSTCLLVKPMVRTRLGFATNVGLRIWVVFFSRGISVNDAGNLKITRYHCRIVDVANILEKIKINELEGLNVH